MSAPATERLTVAIGDHEYALHLGAGGLVGELGRLWAPRAAGTGVLLAHDGNVADLARRAAAALRAEGLDVSEVAVEPGERSKSLSEVERLCRAAASAGLRRDDAIVAVGGGVVGDLVGYVAASYQRGVRLVHVPTTLLAMVDSAIGGKTGVDLPEGKNYVGAIWQPELVLMDVGALETLSARELACGFAEVVKYGLLSGEELFSVVERWPELPGPGDELIGLIRRCVEHKLDVVAQDERDLGIRASLNLGHTIGHGIEAAGGYDLYHHGEAISLGLLAALRIAEHVCGLPGQWRERTVVVLERHGLPTRLSDTIATDEITAAMGRDKKADASSLNMVLLDAPGSIRLRQNPPRDLILDAIEELRS